LHNINKYNIILNNFLYGARNLKSSCLDALGTLWLKPKKSMANYTFKETLRFFSDKLHASPPEEDLEGGEVELVIDTLTILLTKGKLEGSLHMQSTLGLFVQPLGEKRLKELATSNFLGVNTGGCKLAFDPSGVILSLHADVTCGTPPQESWEWLHRLLCVAREWNKVLATWDEFIPMTPSSKEDTEGANPIQNNYKA
jgi:hypothetical protein